MIIKYLIYFLPIISVIGKQSFTLVIDTTVSMQDEFDVIKSNIGAVMDSIPDVANIENYILVPFNDPEVGPAKIFATPNELINTLNSLTIGLGKDCPEYSMSGLEQALQASKPESNIFLFTDAFAIDANKSSEIQNLCRSTRSKVHIFLSGRCSTQKGSVDVYYDVTDACSGNVFQFEPFNLRQAFNFMKEIMKEEYNDVNKQKDLNGYKQIEFLADGFTRDMMVAATGDSPVFQVLHVSGQEAKMETIIDNSYSKVYKLIELEEGTYQIRLAGQGRTSLSIYKKLPFQIGFSFLPPGSIKETSSRPLPDRINYILIVVPKPMRIQLKTLIYQVVENGVEQNLNLIEIRANSGIYTQQAYFAHSQAFRFTITGQVTSSFNNISMTTNIFEPQNPGTFSPLSKATVEIIVPETTVIYGQNTSIPCKVHGSPKPYIWWEDEQGQQMRAQEALLEYPSTHISYVYIENFTKNETLYCKAQTSNEEDSKSVQLYAYRPYTLDVVQAPTDTTIEYEHDGQLFCEIKAYPDAHVKWYHNGNLIENNEVDPTSDFEIKDDRLIIKNMSTTYTGEYTCEAQNEARSLNLSAYVDISGLEQPEVYIKDSEIIVLLGDQAEVNCRLVKGRPEPVISWKYKSIDGYDSNDLPEGVSAYEGRLIFSEINLKHKGTYVCSAVNEKGEDHNDVNVNVQYEPVIEEFAESTMDTNEGKIVVLKCNVDADPKAEVHWEHYYNNVMVPLEERHITDEDNTLRFEAENDDTGDYHCVAENDAGRAKKKIFVNVLVRPYIKEPAYDTITVRSGDDVILPCNVIEGNPTPSITWNLIDSTFKEIFRGASLRSKTLNLNNISPSQQGKYVCIAENSVGFDSITTNVVVV